MKSTRTISGVTFLDLRHLWSCVSGIALKERARVLMKNAGVRFFDNENMLVAQPVVALAGVGGLPFTWDANAPEDSIALSVSPQTFLRIEDLSKTLEEMMGYGGFFTYLNPKDSTPKEMAEKMSNLKHFSTAHTITLNIAVLGVSTAVENEFNSQRDLLHFSRLTEARTLAQSDPSTVVLFPEFQYLYSEIRKLTLSALSTLERDGARKAADSHEAENLAFPAAKATLFMISGTVRNFQKLASTLSDSGKEEEYRRVVALITDQLAVLFPNLFEQSKTMGYSYPQHYERE